MRSSLHPENVQRSVASVVSISLALILCSRAGFGQGSDHYDRGWEAESQREFDQAIDQYTLAIDAGDLDAVVLSQVYSRRASVWAHLCESGRAIDDFTRAIELDPTNGVAYSLRGYLRGQSGQAELAAQDHLQALALADQQSWEDYRAWALQHLADLYRRQGEYELALQTCDEALQDSDYATVYFRRAWILLDQRDLSRATTEFDTYLRKAAEQELSRDLLWPDEEIAVARMERLLKNR